MNNSLLRLLTLAIAGILITGSINAQSPSGDAKAGKDLFVKYS